MFSYWEQTTFLNHIDLAIVGSGIVGINAAIRYKEQHPDAKVVVLERGALPSGASTKNAGFACFGSLTELIEDSAQQGTEQMWKLVEQRWRGLRRLRERVGDRMLQFKQWGGYELFRPTEAATHAACLDKITEYNEVLSEITGIKAVFQQRDDAIERFGFAGVQHLIHNCAEGQIHTGQMMFALLRRAREMGVIIYNGFGVERLEAVKRGVAVFQSGQMGGQLHARKVLVATNGFARQFFPQLDVQPARNQVIITDPIADLRIKGTFHYDRGYFYFRNIDNRILLGGGRQLDKVGETTMELGQTPQIQQALRTLLHEVILARQDVGIAQSWSGILGVGEEKRSIVEAVESGIYVAVRLGGMGIAIGTLIGEAAADMLRD